MITNNQVIIAGIFRRIVISIEIMVEKRNLQLDM